MTIHIRPESEVYNKNKTKDEVCEQLKLDQELEWNSDYKLESYNENMYTWTRRLGDVSS